MTATLEKWTSTTVRFEQDYNTDLDWFWIVILVIFIIIHVVALFLTVWKLYCWCVLYPIDGSGTGAIFYGIIRFVYYVLESWTTVVFWFLFGVSFYWFVFFKLQNAAHVLTPSLHLSYKKNWMRFDILFGIMASLKLIVMVLKVFFQA